MSYKTYETKGKLALIKPKNLEKILIVGDLHGDLQSLIKIKDIIDRVDLAIFLGDYADRGPHGFEVIEKLKKLEKEYDKKIILLKGNHEDYSEKGSPLFSPCTLIDEIYEKGLNWEVYFKKLKKEFLDKLFVAALLPKFALFVHGGISNRIKSIQSLVKPSREVELDLLWNDPINLKKDKPNLRGIGIYFGKDTIRYVKKSLDIKYIIRSHESYKVLFGPLIQNGVITISSTSVYGGKPFGLVLSFPFPKITKKNLKKFTLYF